VQCFITCNATGGEIVDSMANAILKNDDGAPTVAQQVPYIVPHGITSRELHTNKFSPEYVNEWSCVSEYCNHPKCDFCCKKHVFLSRITVCDNRIDMCSECWKKFDNTGNSETKKD
jgi:hypothetical protein